MKTVIRNSYTPKTGDYCETIVVDRETNNAYIFDCDGVFTPVPQPVDVEEILRQAAEYTDEQVAPLAEKLDTIEEGAQVNVIEEITQNGVPLHVIDKSVDISVPTQTSDLVNNGSDGTDTYVESAALSDYYTKSETNTQIGYETNAREIADQGLQEQIDAIVASSDVVDIVGTYAALQAYDTTKLHDNDIIKVLADETRDGATTYYRWDKDTSTWSYIGAEGPFYTKAESDATFVPQTRTINSKALSSDITLTAADVGALPDSTVIPTVNDATLTIQKNGTDVATFTANSNTNTTANISVPTDTSDLTNGAGFITSSDLPTKTSELQNDGADGTSTYVEADEMPTNTSDFVNDGSDGTSTYVEADELGAAAFSNKYTDLDNLPVIPTVNDGTLTIQENGTLVNTFTANQSGNTTVNITVPTDTGDLTNNAGFITSSVNDLTNYYLKTDTYTQQEVNGLISALNIPTKTSDLQNDSGFLTSIPIASANDLGGIKVGTGLSIDANGVLSVTSAGAVAWADVTGKPTDVSYWNNDAGYITSAAIPTNVSSFNNDAGYITSAAIPTNVSSFNNDAGYLTSSDLSNYYTKTETYSQQEVNALINAIPTYSDFTGATSGTAGAHGLVPAPAAGDEGKYLKGDGTWATASGTITTFHWGGSPVYSMYKDSGYTTAATYSDIATAFAAGPVYISDGEDEVTYVVVSDIPDDHTITVTGIGFPGNEGGSTSYAYASSTWTKTATEFQKKLTAGTNVQINGTTISATDTTYSAFTGATSSIAGAAGLVPAPTTSDPDKFLKGDGTWAKPEAELVEMYYGESNAWAKFIAAYTGKKIVYCRASSNANPGSGAKTRKAFMAYVNNEDSPTSVEFQYVRSVSSKTDSQQCDQVFVYTLTNAAGGTWSVTSRNMAAKINVDSSLTKTFSNGANASMTLSANAMTGATSGTAGTAGYVPAPAAGDNTKFLKGDGTWASVSAGSGQTVIYRDLTSSFYSDSGCTDALSFSEITTMLKDGPVLIAPTGALNTYSLIVYFFENGGGGGSLYVETGGSYESYSYASDAATTFSDSSYTLQKQLTAGTNVQINGTTISATDTTYSDFTGTDGIAAGAAGLVPAPATTDVNKYLNSDGIWEPIPDNSPKEFYWYNDDLCSENATWTQVDPSDVEYTYLSHPILIYNYSTYSYESVVSFNPTSNIIEAVAVDPISLEQRLVTYKYNEGFMNVWTRSETEIQPKLTAGSNITIAGSTISATDTTYSDMVGATSLDAGANGLVPAPAAGDQDKVLSGAGTWVSQPTVPTVNDATLTIQKNGTTVNTFTANASSNVTANITVPTQFSDLSGTVGSTQFANNTIDKAKINWSTFRANFTASTDGNGFLAVPNTTVKPTTGFILGARMYNKDGICTVYNGYSEGRYTLKCTDWNWVPYGNTSIRCEIIYCLINFA